MTEPERLLEHGTDFERALLGSVVAQKPSAALVQRMEAGLGLASATTATAATAISAKAIAAAVGAVTAGGFLIYGLVVSTSPSAPSDVPAAVPAQHGAIGSEPGPAVEPALERSLAPAVDSPVTDPPARTETDGPGPTPRRPAAPASVDAPRRDPLKLEVRQLDRVRAALAAGDRDTALERLDSYDRRFPNGVLSPEAAQLRRSANALEP